MKILFDARMQNVPAGIGSYIRGLIPELKKTLKKDFSTFNYAFPHYSIKEQYLPLKLKDHQFDLIHYPHFNVPLFTPKPFIVTIHDLLWHHTRGIKVTTLSPLKYLLKYSAYKKTVSHAIKSSAAVIVPSNFVKNQIINQFPRVKNNIHVTYEGINPIFFKKRSGNEISQSVQKPFVIYTGALYPHKNIKRLALAVNQTKNLTLYISSAPSIFTDRFKEFLEKTKLSNRVKLLGYVPNKELVSLYHQAEALIHPSLSEGFSLTGIEAMAAKLPVIASRMGSIPEIYGDHASYIQDAENVDSITAAIVLQLEKTQAQKKKQIQEAYDHAQTFTWEKCAKKTLAVYQSVLESERG